MSKVVEYKGEKFAGSVTFSDPLTLDQEAAFEEAQAAANILINTGNRGASSIMRAALPGIFTCIEKWELTGVPASPTLETWPLRPRVEVAKLFAWLIEQITILYLDSTDTIAPNA